MVMIYKKKRVNLITATIMNKRKSCLKKYHHPSVSLNETEINHETGTKLYFASS